jgi:phosphatidylserine/phosphatidylglycerophosphate/cardiolipin synthase-like enzyme
MRSRSPIFLLLLLLIAGIAYYANRVRNRDDAPDRHDASTDREEVAETGGEGGPVPGGAIAVYFSNAYTGDPAVGRDDPTNIDRVLAREIARAERTLDCALFELESARLAEQLIAAHNRGVVVRIVAEEDYIGNPEMMRVIAAGIPVMADGRSASMHNKFIVIDADRVWTGSMNLTDNDAWRNNNNAVLIRSRELAENFRAEFDEMYSDSAFGPRSPSNTPHSLVTLPDADIYTYFSPEDDVRSKVIRFLRLAKRKIRFMSFSFTDDEIGARMIAAHEQGVDVEGVVETRGALLESGELTRMIAAGIPVATDGNRFILHHKVIVVDGTWTILGSYNFSANAAESNDENLLIIKSPAVAALYEAEYERVAAMVTR